MRLVRHKSGFFTLPLGVAIVSSGYAGCGIRVTFLKYSAECEFKWPCGKMLLRSGIYHILPCIKRHKGGIYGTPHGDFYWNHIEFHWWNKSVILWRKKS